MAPAETRPVPWESGQEPGLPLGSYLKERIPKLKSSTEFCIQSSDRGTRRLKHRQESDEDTRGGFPSSNTGPLEALEDKNRTDIQMNND